MTFHEWEDNTRPAPESVHSQHHKSTGQLGDRIALYARRYLEQSDRVVYSIVGVCFLIAAFLALVYTFWAFGVSVIELRSFPMDKQLVHGAQAIIELISGLLLVLIIMEMLGTVIHFLRVHTMSLRPYLVIGIISATRSILSIGARLSVEGLNVSVTDFAHAMIELGVSAAVILALGITIKLLGRLMRIDESE